MLKNYLKTTLRNFKRNKLYAFLNVFGLSIGLASFFLIYLFLNNELAYDQFHEKSDRIYRVIQETQIDGNISLDGGLTSALAPVAGEQIPEIEAWSRVESWPKSVKVPESKSDSTEAINGLAVDPGFLEFFDLNVFLGKDIQSVFSQPNEIMVSESFAERHFIEPALALDQTVTYRNNDFTIKSIYKDIPATSSLTGDLIGHILELNAWRQESVWTSWNVSYFDQSYFLLNDVNNLASIEEKLNEIATENGFKEEKNVSLQPIADVHFSLDVNDAVNSKTDKQYVFIFSVVGLFILICAVFNYISLFLSHALERMKEVGVRKVVGAQSGQLIIQFLIEAVLYVSIAFILAVVLVELLVPQLQEVLGRSLEMTLRNSPEFIIYGYAFSLVLAVIAGLYPAYIGARQKAVGIFGKAKGRWGAQHFINGITIFQLIVFMVLISVAFTAKRQISFMQNDNLGFEQDNQLVVQMFSQPAQKNADIFKNRLNQLPYVETYSMTTSVPTRVMGSMRTDAFDFKFFNFNIDENYLKALEMELVAGRNFEATEMGREDIVMVNETAIKKMGLTPEEAVGSELKFSDENNPTIIGVVNDFHFLSKKQPMEATLFKPFSSGGGVLLIKLKGDELINEVDGVKEVFSETIGGPEMTYFFLQDQINSQYKQEKVIITVINAFTVLAAIVAVLGIFGMAGYATKKRLKEMGIRKVLGAGFISIQRTMNWSNFLKLAIAAIVGLPLIYLWMEDWLSSFAYRIDFPVGIIFGALLITFVTVLITVSFHSIKAYLINPVEILKDE